MTITLHESDVEEAALLWLEALGYTVLSGPDIAPGELAAERDDYSQVLLTRRLRQALVRLNPGLPADALDEAYRQVTHPNLPSLVANNRAFHRLLVDGVTVEYPTGEGRVTGAQVRLLDYDNPAANDWLAVNQFTLVENHHNRRPDIVLFVNGLPLAVIELKNAADENATIWDAFHQLQTYKAQIPSLFTYNEILVISDGLEARLGALTSDRERFLPWRTIEDERLAPATMSQLEALLRGVFDRRRFLDLVRYFIVFEADRDAEPVKKIAAYHQFHAVQRAVETTVQAARPGGDHRAGVIWHTQGSGKSLTMAFYAGRIILHPEMANPTIVVLTDRNDLDNQLFGTFARCQELLRQAPVQAESRDHLRQRLQVAAGGVVFTTIQKFFPDEKGGRHPRLSERHNIVVIADEAHRSQYDFIDGFAAFMRQALPHATFMGFTGTPIEQKDANTPAVFGDYVSIYDIQRAVSDGATVPIYYESRLAQLALDPQERPHIDPDFDEVTEGEELERKEKLKTRWSTIASLVGADRRLQLIAADLVEHWERRLTAIEGKALIVCMTRPICVDLYNHLVRLRPAWHSPDDAQGVLKIVMTGSAADPLDMQPHIRSKAGREALAERFKNPADPLKLVIVRDMWLTGFDVPSLHTMYLDKPMRGHNLMQAIARVNRVFKDKPGGLLVDYLGLAFQLQQALADYTASGGRGQTAIDQEQALDAVFKYYEICQALFHSFDWTLWRTGTGPQRLSLLPAAADTILGQPDGKNRLNDAVTGLSQAFALTATHPHAIVLQDDIAFFQAVRVALRKLTPSDRRPGDELDHAVRQIVSRAVAAEGVIDIFAITQLDQRDLSILSDPFLADVEALPYQNLAVEILHKLLHDEIKARTRTNLILARSFAGLLDQSIRAYQNRAIETAQVIDELVALARELRAASQRGQALGLTDAELAFYDALEVNDSAVQILGDATLRTMARELTEAIRQNVTIDWTVKENVRAKLRVLVRRTLRRYGYPPDKQEKAAQTVLEQAELIAKDWAG